MKVSAKEQYGLRAMIELAGRYGQGAVSLSIVAKSQGISLDYLEQIVPDLRDAGLVHSKRGAHGGYRLARSPDEITVDQILTALDGTILPIRCVSEEEHTPCERSADCGARTVWETLHARVSEALSGMTLADL